MKLTPFIIFVVLVISGCSDSSYPIKLVCEGEGEQKVIKSFEKDEVTKIKVDRTYLITNEDAVITTNENGEFSELKTEKKKSPTIKFKSYFADESISDGSHYSHKSRDEINGKYEHSSYEVRVLDNKISVERRNSFTPIKHSENMPERTIYSLKIEIDRISGKFTEQYETQIENGLLKGTFFQYKTITGSCKKIVQNQF